MTRDLAQCVYGRMSDPNATRANRSRCVMCPMNVMQCTYRAMLYRVQWARRGLCKRTIVLEMWERLCPLATEDTTSAIVIGTSQSDRRTLNGPLRHLGSWTMLRQRAIMSHMSRIRPSSKPLAIAALLWIVGWPLLVLNPATGGSDLALLTVWPCVLGLVLLFLAGRKARRGAPGAAAAWGCVSGAALALVGLPSLSLLRPRTFLGAGSGCDIMASDCGPVTWQTIVLAVLPVLCFLISAVALYVFIRACSAAESSERGSAAAHHPAAGQST